MSTKRRVNSPADEPCKMCSFIASTLLGPSRKAFKDSAGNLVPLVITKLVLKDTQTPARWLKLLDGKWLPICEECAAMVVHWIKRREEMHFAAHPEVRQILTATKQEMEEIVQSKKGPTIIVPGMIPGGSSGR